MSRSPSWFRAHAGRRDSNHKAIVDGLRKLGHLVIDTAACGGGVPDLCVYPRSTFAMLKPEQWNGDELAHVPPAVWLELKVAKGKLRASQLEWRAKAEARGLVVHVARSLDEALEVLGA